MIIIGNGMIARAFSTPELISLPGMIFASGVSDSSCTSEAEFDRERRALIKTLATFEMHCPIIYFGTCSEFDPEQQSTPYVRHKIEMARLVVRHPCGYVFRLPQVVGRQPNPNTLLAYLVRHVSSGEHCAIWRTAWRNIIDIDDVVDVISELIREGFHVPRMLNIANPISFPMPFILSEIEVCLKRKANVTFINKGSRYEIDIGTVTKLSKAFASKRFTSGYIQDVVEKYFA